MWLSRADIFAVVGSTTPDKITSSKGAIRNYALIGNTAWPAVPLVRAALPGAAEPHGPSVAVYALECLGFTTLRPNVFTVECRPTASSQEELDVSKRVVEQGREAALNATLRPRRAKFLDPESPMRQAPGAQLSTGEIAALRVLLAERLQPSQS